MSRAKKHVSLRLREGAARALEGLLGHYPSRSAAAEAAILAHAPPARRVPARPRAAGAPKRSQSVKLGAEAALALERLATRYANASEAAEAALLAHEAELAGADAQLDAWFSRPSGSAALTEAQVRALLLALSWLERNPRAAGGPWWLAEFRRQYRQ